MRKIQSRANKAAREYMRQMFLKGKSYGDLPFQARVNIDKKVEKKKYLAKILLKPLKQSNFKSI